MSLAGPPTASVVIPRAVEKYIGGRLFRIVWLNELGGLTFRIGTGTASVHLKWTSAESGVDLKVEEAKLRWARAFTLVPEVIDFGSDADGSWLVTKSIDAENAVSRRWGQDPGRATAALGQGLRGLHDALPVSSCPYSWSLEERLSALHHRFASGALSDDNRTFEIASRGVPAALLELASRPDEDVVVCHGDACAPNTLVGTKGRWIGHVDLGALGVGDRWADLAIMSWSAVWNYGPQWEMNIYSSYGIEPDQVKIRYYRLLWELE